MRISENMDDTRSRDGDTTVHVFDRSSVLIFAAVCVLFIGARLWRLTASCLWFDEIFSVHTARHGWSHLIHFAAADIIHPPLFYVLLKAWTGIGGESLLWLRLFPALVSIAVIYPFFLFCRALHLRPGAINTALLLLAVSGYQIKYAQELRMYSLLSFFTICSLWLFVGFITSEAVSKRRLFVLFVVNLSLVYTHYYGWLVVALEALALLLWNRRRLSRFMAGVAGLLVCYAPWVYEVATVTRTGGGLGQNIGWMTRPRTHDLAAYFALLNQPFVFSQSSASASYNSWGFGLALALFGLPLAVLLWRVRRSKASAKNRGVVAAFKGLYLFSFAPALSIFLLSWVAPHSVWGTRHLIIAAAPYAVLAALALMTLRPFWVKTTILLILCCWIFLTGAYALARRAPIFIWCSWEQLARQMMAVEADSRDAVRVYTYEDLIAYHLWYALNANDKSRFKVTVIKGVAGMPDDPAYFLPRDFNDVAVQNNSPLEGREIWVAYRAANWDENQLPLNILENAGYVVDRVLTLKTQGQQQAFLVRLRRR